MWHYKGRRIRSLSALLCLTTVSGLAAEAAMAQVAVPRTLEPARLPQNLERLPRPEAQPQITVQPAEPMAAPDQAEAIAFTYQGLRIEGARALPEPELRKLWPHEVGATATVAEIFAFAQAITEAYRRAGYALSFAVVGEQEILDGTFTVRVVEGYVERIAIEGDVSFLLRTRIEAMASRITASRPLKVRDLERYMLLINDLPGVTVSSVLSPGAAEGGALLTLKVDHQAFGGTLGYNSFMPGSLGRHIVEASVEGRGLTVGSDLIRIGAQRSLTSDAYWSVSGEYTALIGADGARFGLSTFYSKSDPEDLLLDLLEYKGDTINARMYAEYPIIRSRSQNLYIGAGLALNNAGSDLLGTRFFDDRLRPLSAWVSYQVTDSTQAVTVLRANVTQGLDILEARGDSRANGRVTYRTVELDAQRNQPLGSALGGMTFLTVAAHAQASLRSGDLFSSAECSFGGRQFGRAFDAGIITGEHCVEGSVELHWAHQAALPLVSGRSVFDLYAFADGGIVWERGALQPGERRRLSAATVGAGLNVQLTRWLTGLVEVGRQVALTGPDDDNATRVTGAVQLRF